MAVGLDEETEQCREMIAAAIRRVDSGDGVDVLVDVFGGQASGAGILSMDAANVEVLAGTNVPALIKLAQLRDELSLSAARKARRSTSEYVQAFSAAPKVCYIGGEALTVSPGGRLDWRADDAQPVLRRESLEHPFGFESSAMLVFRVRGARIFGLTLHRR